MKTLDSFNFKDKVVLLRADLNSDIHNNRVLMSERIKESVLTIKELKKKKAKIVILAHQGQPGRYDFISLKQHSKILNNLTKVKFINNKKIEKTIKSLRPGQAVLLENLRFEKDEFKPEKGKKNKLYKLVELAEFYVNDAFSVCHRKQASIVLLPKYLKSCAGRLLEKEVRALKKVSVKNCLYILGGSKPEDNIKLLKGKKVLACGLFGQLCLIARGVNLGAQNSYLKKEIPNFNQIIKILKKRQKNVMVPVDFAVKVGNKRKELKVEQFSSKYEIFDIGQQTQKLFAREIKKARAIYMKGPAGYCADRKFAKGTVAILKAIACNKGFSLIGGGHLNDAVQYSRVNKKKFGHISLSGGALLRVVAGEKLPGLEVLK